MARKLLPLTEFLNTFIGSAFEMCGEKITPIDRAKRERMTHEMLTEFTTKIGVPERFLSILQTPENPERMVREAFAALNESSLKLEITTKTGELAGKSILRLAAIKIMTFLVEATLTGAPWAKYSSLQEDIGEAFRMLRLQRKKTETEQDENLEHANGENGPEDTEKISFRPEDKEAFAERFGHSLFSIRALLNFFEKPPANVNIGQYL